MTDLPVRWEGWEILRNGGDDFEMREEGGVDTPLRTMNSTVIGLSDTKLESEVLNSEIKIEGYDLSRFNRFL